MTADRVHLGLVRALARLTLLAYAPAFRRGHRDAFGDAAEHRWRRERLQHPGRTRATWRTAMLLIGEMWRMAPVTWRQAKTAADAPIGARAPLHERLLSGVRAFARDARFGARLLWRQPGFTAAGATVLALGIGANTAMFSLVNVLVLKPRAGGVDASLVSIHSRDRVRPDVYRSFSFREYAELRAEGAIFQSVSAHAFGLVGIKDGDVTRRAFADIVTAEFFETFGVRPILGRAFTEDEARPGADVPVAILSHSMWQRLGGDSSVLARTVRLNGRVFTIVGVAPRGFGGSLAIAAPEVWVPTGMYESMAFDLVNEGLGAKLADPRHRNLTLIGRLHEGATLESVAPGLEVVSRQRETRDPAENRDQAIEMSPLSRVSVSPKPEPASALSGVAVFLLACSGVVLLIASFNLANMLLARGRSRRQEFAIRLAIGGSRARVVRQLLTESLLVALVGAGGGILLAWWAIRGIVHALPASLPFVFNVDPAPDARVLLATLGFAVAGTLLSGLGPALYLSRTNLISDLRRHTGDPAAPRARFTRDALVTAQLALTLVMLTGAGLFVRGAFEAARSDPGFTLERGIMANIDTSLAGHDVARTLDIQRDLLARLRALPGVERASLGSMMPFGEFSDSRDVQRAGAPIRRGDPNADAALIQSTTTSIASGYFATLGIPIVRGREFTEAEELSPNGEPIAMIDETLAARLFGDEDPIGQLIQFGLRNDGDPPEVRRIVGIAGGIRDDLFDDGPQPFVYTPIGGYVHTNVYFHLKTAAPTAAAEAAMLPLVRDTLRAVDPQLPIVTLETRPMFRERSLMIWILNAAARITGVLAAAALAVALVGVYGVKAYLVARRTREIGIRLALGATPRQVVSLVFRDGLVLAATGLAAGVLLSVVAGRLVRSLLFQGHAFDLPVVLIAALALVLASAVATWLPARRALRIQPTLALRTD